jgi:hypothetical protein
LSHPGKSSEPDIGVHAAGSKRNKSGTLAVSAFDDNVKWMLSR